MKTYYVCSYCGFKLENKAVCYYHEKSCVKNPNVKHIKVVLGINARIGHSIICDECRFLMEDDVCLLFCEKLKSYSFQGGPCRCGACMNSEEVIVKNNRRAKE